MRVFGYLGSIALALACGITLSGQTVKPELLVTTGHERWMQLSAVQISPDGKFLATGDSTGVVKLWGISNGFELGAYELECIDEIGNCVTNLSFSPDGQQLGVVGQMGSYLIELRTGKLLRLSEELDPSAPQPERGADEEIDRPEEPVPSSVTGQIVFSADGRKAAGISPFGQLSIWSTMTGQTLAVARREGKLANALFLSPDGGRLTSLDCSAPEGGDRPPVVALLRWDGRTGRLISETPSPIPATSASVCGFNPTGTAFAVSDGNDLDLYDVRTFRRIGHFTGPPAATAADEQDGTIPQIVFSPNNQYAGVFSSPNSENLSIHIWRISDRHLTNLDLKAGGNFAFSPDARTIAVDGRLYDLSSGQPVKSFLGTSSSATSAVIHPRRPLLAIGGGGTITIWDLERNGIEKTIQVPTGARNSRFNATGTKLISAGFSKTALVDFATGAVGPIFPGQMSVGFEMPVFAFNADESRIAILSFENCQVSIWDTSTGDQVKVMEGCGDNVKAFAFSADGTVLGGFGADYADGAFSFKTWNVATGEETGLPVSYSGPPSQTILPGKLRVETGRSRTKLIDAVTDKELAALVALGDSDWLVVTPEGLFDGSPAGWKKLAWRLERNHDSVVPVEAFFRHYYYPGLLQELLSGKRPQPPSTDLARTDIRQPDVRIASIGGQIPTAASGDALPKTNLPVAAREAEVVVEVTDNMQRRRQPGHPPASGAKDLRLFRNGSLVHRWNGDVFDPASGCRRLRTRPTAPRRAQCRATITVPAGKISLTAYAFNHNEVKSRDASVELEGAASAARTGTMYVLAVGVNDYAAENGIDVTQKKFKLNYAVADVQAIGTELAARQSAATGAQYARIEVITLTNAEATKPAFMAALRRLADGDGEPLSDLPESLRIKLGVIRRAQPEDALVIYFAGHGLAQNDRFYLIPHDGIPPELAARALTSAGSQNLRLLVQIGESGRNLLEQLFVQSISDVELEQTLARVDVGKLLMVIDACNSGQALESEEPRRGPMNSRGLAQLAYEKGMYILTASQSRQAALELQRLNHGLLTFTLLEGLGRADTDNDHAVTDREWLDYAVGQVPQQLETYTATQRGQTQTPRVFYRRELDPSPLIMARVP